MGRINTETVNTQQYRYLQNKVPNEWTELSPEHTPNSFIVM